MQRAQDKIAGMQARAGAIDELLASGALTDLDDPVDDIQAQLDKVSATQVDSELAALKAEIASGAPARPGGRQRRASPADAEIVHRGRRRPSRPDRGGRRATLLAPQPEVTI
jgi:phage shock protein A